MVRNFKQVSWAEGANIYEVNIRQYTPEGSFEAFAQHLPRLKDMGVDIIWLMPVTPISSLKRQGTLGSYYACSSYTDINPEFGSPEDFRRLVEQVHTLDMKLIIDWVANHTGCDHLWTKEHPDFYIKDAEGNFTEKNGWIDVIDLDFANKEMRTQMIKALQFWVTEFNIDGFRADMAHLVPLDFWREARTRCDGLKPLFWLAECDNEAYLEVFDTSYAWEWMHVSEKFIKGFHSLHHMKDVLKKYLPQNKLYYTANHDENSWNGTEYEKYGNAAKAFAVLTCTWPGIPLLYSGQELPNLKRLKFFDKDIIEWTDNEPALHDFYKTLLQCRKTNAVFCSDAGFIELSHDADDKVLAYLLNQGSDTLLVLINFSAIPMVKISVSHPLLNNEFRNIFSELHHQFAATEKFELQAWEYFVYELSK